MWKEISSKAEGGCLSEVCKASIYVWKLGMVAERA